MERDAEERIVRMIGEHQGALLRLCYLYLHDSHLAEDAVQETFIRAARGLDAFRGECSEKTWLTGIAMRVCCDMRRGFWFRRVDRRVTIDMLPDGAQEASDDARELTVQVMNLPRRLRDAVILHYYQGLSVTETAQVLGISQPSASSRLKRGRERLRLLMEGGDMDDE